MRFTLFISRFSGLKGACSSRCLFQGTLCSIFQTSHSIRIYELFPHGIRGWNCFLDSICHPCHKRCSSSQLTIQSEQKELRNYTLEQLKYSWKFPNLPYFHTERLADRSKNRSILFGTHVLSARSYQRSIGNLSLLINKIGRTQSNEKSNGL